MGRVLGGVRGVWTPPEFSTPGNEAIMLCTSFECISASICRDADHSRQVANNRSLDSAVVMGK